ncbi:MAG: hypothetical protein OXG82_17890 [Gammaproteobacteria bacterium]|nr:hypothetical protein [Gammaproteobacteria bacterium]
MTVPSISLLFPSARFLGLWILVAIGLIFALLPTPSGFPAGNGGIICTTVAAVLWASDCLRRARQWDATTLVPGYATAAWAVALGIVWGVVALATAISGLAGNVAPAFGLAALGGTILVLCFTYSRRRSTWQFGKITLVSIAFVTLITDHRGVIPWHPVTLPAAQSAALVLAIVAAALLRKRLGTPTRPHTDNALRWRYFHPRVAGLTFLLGFGQPPMRIAEAILIGITASTAVGAYIPFESWAEFAAVAVGIITFVASLTPLMVLKVAAAWLPTAWQLGIGDSRRDLGRLFAARMVIVTLATFGLAVALVGVQALFGAQLPSRPGLENQFDETLLLCATCLIVFIVACSVRPTRTAKRPSQLGSLALVCAAFLFVSFSAPSFGPVGRMVLLSVVAGSAALAVYVGGRLVARFDFLPTNEE